MTLTTTERLTKIEQLATLIETQGQERLKQDKLDCEGNLKNAVTSVKLGNKYTKIDVGTSGRYMIDSDGNIFGIKAYGVIHRGHHYGTLETMDKYYWGDYTAKRIK